MGFLHSLKKKSKSTGHALAKTGKTVHALAKKTEKMAVAGAKTLDHISGKVLTGAERVLDVADALAPALSIIPGGALIAETVHGADDIVHAVKDERHAIKKAASESHRDYQAVKGALSGKKDIVSRARELNKAVETGHAHGGVHHRSRIERHRKK